MKFLSKIILVSLISSSNFICIETVYSDQPIATKYDKTQDKRIDKNEINIDKNKIGIKTNKSNITINKNDISTINTNIGDLDYDTYYVTDGEPLTSSINSLDQQTFINSTSINNNSQRLDNHEGRISDLEETKMNLVGEVQFIRKKNHTVSAYTKYDVRHSRVPEVGLKLTVGLGKSWTQEELERLETKLNKIEKLLHRVVGKKEPIETKMIKTNNGYSIVIDEPNTVKLLKKF